MKKVNIASIVTFSLKPAISIFGTIIGLALIISVSIADISGWWIIAGIGLLCLSLLCLPRTEKTLSEIDIYNLTKKFPNITEEEFLTIKNLKRENILKLFLESFDETNKSDPRYVEARDIYVQLLKEKINAIKEKQKENQLSSGDWHAQKEIHDPFKAKKRISPDPTLDNK